MPRFRRSEVDSAVQVGEEPANSFPPEFVQLCERGGSWWHPRDLKTHRGAQAGPPRSEADSGQSRSTTALETQKRMSVPSQCLLQASRHGDDDVQQDWVPH